MRCSLVTETITGPDVMLMSLTALATPMFPLTSALTPLLEVTTVNTIDLAGSNNGKLLFTN